jgi:hypothetical protein
MRKWTIVVLLAAVLIGFTAPAALARKKSHGPPRWAPAHGYRRKHRVVYRTYAPAPFIYSGVTYIPLRDVTSLIGAALLWDSLQDRAMVTYNGREIGLVVGSPTVIYGGETVVLRAAPVVVNNVVYVPAEFCDRYLEVPVEHSRGALRIKGHEGWHDFKVSSRPPGRVIARERPERRGERREIVRPRAAKEKGWKQGGSSRSYGKPAKEHTYRAIGQGREKAKGGGHGGPKARGEGRAQKVKGEGGKGHGGGQGHGGGKEKGGGKGRDKGKD